MRQTRWITAIVLSVSILATGCGKKIKQVEDEIYSRHLQEHIKLTIISTPPPDDKSDFNLLLLNDGQDMDKLRVKLILDSLNKKKLIKPLIVVGIHAVNRNETFGVAGMPDYLQRGSKADKYASFIDNELYDFVKKKTGVRKFASVSIAGFSLGGLSAFDFAWDHADKISNVGVFSGSFWWRNKDDADSTYSDAKNRIILNKIKSSRKKPKLKYWFYAGAKEETNDRDKDGVIDVIDDTKDLIELIKTKKVVNSADIVYTENPEGLHDNNYWSHALPDFLIWAFGK